jgi:hypothetical protein
MEHKICVIHTDSFYLLYILDAYKRCLFAKITGPFSPTAPPFATRSARIDGDVEASDGESGNV